MACGSTDANALINESDALGYVDITHCNCITAFIMRKCSIYIMRGCGHRPNGRSFPQSAYKCPFQFNPILIHLNGGGRDKSSTVCGRSWKTFSVEIFSLDRSSWFYVDWCGRSRVSELWPSSRGYQSSVIIKVLTDQSSLSLNEVTESSQSILQS